MAELTEELLAIRQRLMDEAAQKRLDEELRKLVGESSPPDCAMPKVLEEGNRTLLPADEFYHWRYLDRALCRETSLP